MCWKGPVAGGKPTHTTGPARGTTLVDRLPRQSTFREDRRGLCRSALSGGVDAAGVGDVWSVAGTTDGPNTRARLEREVLATRHVTRSQRPEAADRLDRPRVGHWRVGLVVVLERPGGSGQAHAHHNGPARGDDP